MRLAITFSLALLGAFACNLDADCCFHQASLVVGLRLGSFQLNTLLFSFALRVVHVLSLLGEYIEVVFKSKQDPITLPCIEIDVNTRRARNRGTKPEDIDALVEAILSVVTGSPDESDQLGSVDVDLLSEAEAHYAADPDWWPRTFLDLLALLELENQRIDAVVSDAPTLRWMIYRRQSFPNLKTVGTRFTNEKLGIALDLGSDELRRAINAALFHLVVNGEYAKIYDKWLNDSATSSIAETTDGTSRGLFAAGLIRRTVRHQGFAYSSVCRTSLKFRIAGRYWNH